LSATAEQIPQSRLSARKRDVLAGAFTWLSAFYVVSMIFLGLHLYHGAWSSVRTLGFAAPTPRPLHRRIALAVAAIVWLGFTLVPFGVIAGLIR